jgi:hypothetical protein
MKPRSPQGRISLSRIEMMGKIAEKLDGMFPEKPGHAL